MSEKRLLEVLKSIILLFITFTYFGPPIISKIGNLNINDYFYNSKTFKGPSNIEAESLRKSERVQSKNVYVPSTKIINKLLDMNNSKIDLISPLEENEENNGKENSIEVRDRKKDLPKRIDEPLPAPKAPSGLNINTTVDNKTEKESEKETTPNFKGGTFQGGSMN